MVGEPAFNLQTGGVSGKIECSFSFEVGRDADVAIKLSGSIKDQFSVKLRSEYFASTLKITINIHMKVH